MNADCFEKAAAALPSVFFESPVDCGVVLGSGWGKTLRCDDVLASVSYSDIPGLGAPSIAGHSGELRLFRRHGIRVAAFLGRRHWYEGEGMEPVVMPVELLRRMSAANLLVTNASGGVNASYRPGDLMMITDHINTVGLNPLIGPVRPGWGERFPDMSEVYSRRLQEVLGAAAEDAGVKLHRGVYAFTSGPVFETPAEIRAYRALGADAVGMSTVPECALAAAIGIPTAGLSCITNMAAGINPNGLNHLEVIEQTSVSTPLMAEVVDAFLKRLSL